MNDWYLLIHSALFRLDIIRYAIPSIVIRASISVIRCELYEDPTYMEVGPSAPPIIFIEFAPLKSFWNRYDRSWGNKKSMLY